MASKERLRKKVRKVNNFKYLGSISNKVSKFKVLIRVSQETATLSKLKIIGGAEHLHLLLKQMSTLVLSSSIYACKSLILTADLRA